jgi:hypothetical protein
MKASSIRGDPSSFSTMPSSSLTRVRAIKLVA